MTAAVAESGPVVPDNQSLLRTAGRLSAALVASARDAELRLAILKRVARELGERGDGYPVFLKLILIISESSEVAAKKVLAATLATALRRSDLPSGPLTSWGASSLWSADTPIRAGALLQQLSPISAPKRQFGPIEYLTAWHAQQTHRTRLGEACFADGLGKLVALVDHDEDARRLYPNKLLTDANNELEGVYTRSTRDLLAQIGSAWQAPDATALSVVASVVDQAVIGHVPSGWYLRDL